MIAVGTKVLVRLLIADDPKQAAAARSYLRPNQLGSRKRYYFKPAASWAACTDLMRTPFAMHSPSCSASRTCTPRMSRPSRRPWRSQSTELSLRTQLHLSGRPPPCGLRLVRPVLHSAYEACGRSASEVVIISNWGSTPMDASADRDLLRLHREAGCG